MNLVERILAVADALDDAEPRGTRDIDVNVFVEGSQADRVFAMLPAGVEIPASAQRLVMSDDQIRVMWDDTPIDLFFAASEFHLEVRRRCLTVPFAGRKVRVLCAEDLAVFKAMFERPKDWVDIATMAESNAVDLAVAAERLHALLGDDSRVGRLRAI